jgi:hypothetical protein
LAIPPKTPTTLAFEIPDWCLLGRSCLRLVGPNHHHEENAMHPTSEKPVFAVGPEHYQPGDIVTLLSGGPDMTVLDACPSCGEVDVAYATPKGKISILTLPAIALELAE